MYQKKIGLCLGHGGGNLVQKRNSLLFILVNLNQFSNKFCDEKIKIKEK
jgi:hypothetical protein